MQNAFGIFHFVFLLISRLYPKISEASLSQCFRGKRIFELIEINPVIIHTTNTSEILIEYLLSDILQKAVNQS